LPLVLNIGGTLSNQAVLYANHDTFPVRINFVKAEEWSPKAVQLDDGTVMLDNTHCLMTPNTHLNLLADNFDFHDRIESLGDLMIEFGQWLWNFAPYVWGFAVTDKLWRKHGMGI
jgi:hypothetical protein